MNSDHEYLVPDKYLQSKGVFVQYKKNRIDGNGSLHHHMGYEIYLFHKGQATLIIGGQVYPLQSGDMILIPDAIPHIARPNIHLTYVRSVINFTDTYLKLFPNAIMRNVLDLFETGGRLVHWDISEQYELEKLISKLQTEFSENKFGAETLGAAFLFQLLIMTYRKVGTVQNSRQLSQREVYVEQTLALINRTYNEEIDLNMIANCININKHYMCHCFKEVTGYTIVAYMQRKRMEEAKKLLQSSNESVTHIASRVGIKNGSHFSRQFKEHYGVTPSAYRKKYQIELKTQLPFS